MAAKYRVVYKDQRQQAVEADGYTVQANFVMFTSNGNPVLSVASENVESIAESDVPEAE